MRIVTSILLLVVIALCARGEPIAETEDESYDLLDCVFDDDAVGCINSRLAKDIDQMEVKTMGNVSGPPMSAVIAKTGRFMAEIVDDMQQPEGTEEPEEADDDDDGHEEARKKKLGKRKKKHLQKLLGLVMLFKAKISLLLQLISTHFQLKFFAIAIISLLLNAARFWLDLKKGHPAKVIYYEHAQHQHHYDHDEHDQNNYWGRSSDNSPQDLAYAAHAPEN